MALIMGLAAALFWGLGDFIVRDVEGRIGVRRALLRGHAITLAVVLCVLPLSIPPNLRQVAPGVWALAGLGAISNLAMITTLYRALAAGPLAAVAPIAGSYAGVAAVLAIATVTDHVVPAVAAVLGCIFLGVVLAGIERDAPGEGVARHGVAWAVACALVGGFSSWLQGVAIVPAVGPVVTLLINAGVVVGACWAVGRASGAGSGQRLDKATIALGLCNALGFLAYLIGLGSGKIVVVSIIGSMAGGVTALLGAVVLRQRLAIWQWVGVVMILGGVALLHTSQA